MFDPKQAVKLDQDPLADRNKRTGVVVAESNYADWGGTARYNVVCLTTDFNKYSNHNHTVELDKNKHTETGSLTDHSLVCPWATLAVPGRSLTHVTTNNLNSTKVTLTDKGHELVTRAVYQFFRSHNNY